MHVELEDNDTRREEDELVQSRLERLLRGAVDELRGAVEDERQGFEALLIAHEEKLIGLREDLDGLAERTAKIALALVEQHGAAAMRTEALTQAVASLKTVAEAHDGMIGRLEHVAGLRKPWWRRWFR